MMQFKKWFEDVEAKNEGIKDTILNLLKDKLNINDDDAILAMPIASISKNVISDLMSRGIINTASDEVSQDIQNGSGTIADLINKLSGMGGSQRLLIHRNPPIQQAPMENIR